MSLALWLIGFLFILGWLFIGLIVLRYRWRQVPQRLAEIEGIVSEDAARCYLQLFAPNLPVDGSAVDRVRMLFLRTHSAWTYSFAGCLLMLASGATLGLGYLWVRGRLLPQDGIFDTPIELILAMAGAYVWCVTELLDRNASRDMTPDDLFRVSLRFLYAVPLGYAFSLLAGTGAVAGLLAFVASSFPVKQARRFLHERVLKTIQAEPSTASAAREARIVHVIHGIGREAVTRLAEIRVHTCVDLAYADPIVLMARTGLSLRTIIDWMDQALLALYVDPSEYNLRKFGLRSALEASLLYEEENIDGDGANSKRIVELAETLGIGPDSVVWMLGQVGEDPHLEFLSLIWGEDVVDEDAEGEEVADELE